MSFCNSNHCSFSPYAPRPPGEFVAVAGANSSAVPLATETENSVMTRSQLSGLIATLPLMSSPEAACASGPTDNTVANDAPRMQQRILMLVYLQSFGPGAHV